MDELHETHPGISWMKALARSYVGTAMSGGLISTMNLRTRSNTMIKSGIWNSQVLKWHILKRLYIQNKPTPNSDTSTEYKSSSIFQSHEQSIYVHGDLVILLKSVLTYFICVGNFEEDFIQIFSGKGKAHLDQYSGAHSSASEQMNAHILTVGVRCTACMSYRVNLRMQKQRKRKSLETPFNPSSTKPNSSMSHEELSAKAKFLKVQNKGLEMQNRDAERMICVNDPYDAQHSTIDDERDLRLQGKAYIPNTYMKLTDTFPSAKAFATLLCSVSNKRRLQKLICTYLIDLAKSDGVEMIYSVGSHCTNMTTQQAMEQCSFDHSEADTVLRESGYNGPVVIDAADVAAAYISRQLPGILCIKRKQELVLCRELMTDEMADCIVYSYTV